MATSRTGTAKYLRNRRTILRQARADGLTHCLGYDGHLCGVELDYRTRAEFERQEPQRAGEDRPNAAETDHILEVQNGGTDDLGNLRVICRKCNRDRNNPRGNRLVVVLCGPPGSGKTTAARNNPHGLIVYDRDDPQWASETAFTAVLRTIGTDPAARAVIIRSGASSSARATAARLVNATHIYLLDAPDAELKRRIIDRGRHDTPGTIAGITRWRDQHDRDDAVPDFPGWNSLPLPAGPTEALTEAFPTSRAW